jgi:hypothetical protein
MFGMFPPSRNEALDRPYNAAVSIKLAAWGERVEITPGVTLSRDTRTLR